MHGFAQGHGLIDQEICGHREPISIPYDSLKLYYFLQYSTSPFNIGSHQVHDADLYRIGNSIALLDRICCGYRRHTYCRLHDGTGTFRRSIGLIV